MTVFNQSFRIMPDITANPNKKNGKLNKGVHFFIKPYILNINLQKDIKVFKEIVNFEKDNITNLKTTCFYLTEHNQLKKG